MTLTKSRRVPRNGTRSSASGTERSHTPALDTLVDPAHLDRLVDKWIAQLDGKKASDADFAVHVNVGALRFQFDYLIEHAFARIAKLEAELRKAKAMVTKSTTPAAAAFEIEQGADGRTFTFKSAAGDQSFTIPVPIFRGAWKEGETYSRGDTVVWGGSSWAAMRQTSNRPDEPESGWMISARKGRDGKSVRAET